MLKSDFYKMFKSQQFYVMLILIVILTIVSGFIVKFSYSILQDFQLELKNENAPIGAVMDYTEIDTTNADSFQEGLRKGFTAGIRLSAGSIETETGEAFADYELENPTAMDLSKTPLNSNSLLVLLASLFTAIFISGEFVHGTLKNSASKGFSRTQLYMSKLIVSIAFGMIILALYTSILFFFGLANWGLGEMSDKDAVDYLIGTLLSLFPYIAYISIATCLSFIMKNGSATAVIILVIIFGGIIFQGIGLLMSMDLGFAWIGTGINVASNYKDNSMQALAASGVGLIYIVASTLIGIGVFQRKDI